MFVQNYYTLNFYRLFKKLWKYLLLGGYNKMFCIIIRKKSTFNFAKRHFKSEKYMNRLLSLKNWDNPPIAPPLLLKNIF